jgi:thioredoxin 1
MSNIKHVTNDSFDEDVAQAQGLVVADFWAEWCGPCRALGPTLEHLASERADDLTVAKIDVDANGELSGRFGISSIPTLIFFRDGEEVGRRVGLLSKSELDVELERLLAA